MDIILAAGRSDFCLPPSARMARTLEARGVPCRLEVWGDEATIRARIKAHHDAGATHVCIQAFRTDGEMGPDLRTLELLAPNRK